MARLRVAFMGSPDLAAPCLTALHEDAGVEVPVVVTVGDSRRGRRGKAIPTPVGERALALNLPLLRWEKGMRRQIESRLAEMSLDLIVVIAFARILKPSLLALPRLGCLNLHASLLPWGRGASPIQQAILEGLATSGWSAMKMDPGLDTGPVLDRLELPMDPRWRGADLYENLKTIAPRFLLDSIHGWDRGRLIPVPQREVGASYAPRIPADAGAVDWKLSAAELDRRIRAYFPMPGSYFYRDGERVRLLAAEPLTDFPDGEPGEVLEAGPRLVIGCGEGALNVIEVLPPGRKPMAVSAWLNGKPLAPGASLEDG
jgi:methionyl-tRNA formyltransferase